jgi:hypothetical protein
MIMNQGSSFNFSYSRFASINIGKSGSASFQMASLTISLVYHAAA